MPHTPEAEAPFALTTDEKQSLQTVARAQPDTRFGRRARGLLALSEADSIWAAAARVGITVEALARWRDLYEQERSPSSVRCHGRRGRYAVVRARLEPILRSPPSAFGYPERRWTPALLRLHLASVERVMVPISVLERWLRDAPRDGDGDG